MYVNGCRWHNMCLVTICIALQRISWCMWVHIYLLSLMCIDILCTRTCDIYLRCVRLCTTKHVCVYDCSFVITCHIVCVHVCKIFMVKFAKFMTSKPRQRVCLISPNMRKDVEKHTYVLGCTHTRKHIFARMNIIHAYIQATTSRLRLHQFAVGRKSSQWWKGALTMTIWVQSGLRVKVHARIRPCSWPRLWQVFDSLKKKRVSFVMNLSVQPAGEFSP